MMNADDIRCEIANSSQIYFGKNVFFTGPTFRSRPHSPSRRAGDKLERSVASLPVLPITLEEVEERTAKWKVNRGTIRISNGF